MIYFHKNDEIVYLTTTGIEKILRLEKVDNKRKKGTCKLVEVANYCYGESQLIRRFILDEYN